MKYVACHCTSSDRVATAMPDNPPQPNRKMKATKYASGVLKSIEPLYIVPSQTKAFTEEKTATAIEKNEKAIASTLDMPETNIWWPHTRNPTTPIPSVAMTIALYDSVNLREK